MSILRVTTVCIYLFIFYFFFFWGGGRTTGAPPSKSTPVHTTKFLGVTIDDKLTWSDHISSISKTISRNVGVLSKLRSFPPPATVVSFYNTLISPYLAYCNIIWARVSTTKLNSLSIIQKRAIRICTFSPPCAHNAPLFAQLNILTLKDINKLLTGIVMYKCVNGLIPRTFSSYFTSVHDTHKHHTRSHNNLILPFTRTSYSIHTLRRYGPRLWNSIDLSIKSKSSVSQFKTSYRNLLVPSI